MLDVAGTHLVAFRAVAWLFGVLCCGDLARKLRLFYYLHLAFPPRLDEVDRPLGNSSAAEVEEETAVEAEEYFDCMEEDSGKGQVDLDLSDDSPTSPSVAASPKPGQCLCVTFPVLTFPV
ncbi:hypothetical protein E2C01_083112 [Portunus trituberculatus]|uniref:Uncharacterized protein n=1 Tax=Portunus trituberculatus TaxID=210409 RepID=A0A5B7J6X5_PORTR|nr:hypothetical protein [Portunus trituberculatus]